MSFSLHKSGLATVMNAKTGASTGKFAKGYTFEKRDFDDPSLVFPFWTIGPSLRTVEQYATVGAGGQNIQVVAHRITLIDKFSYLATDRGQGDQDAEDAFVTLVDGTLTELRKDANVNLGQSSSGCIWNKIISVQFSYNMTNTPPLRICTVECQAEYVINRT